MTRSWPTLLGDEVELPDEDSSKEEKLFRQVTEHQWDAAAAVPASTAFGPANIDGGRASYSRASRTSAQAARDWHQDNAKARSVGVWSVTVEQVLEHDLRSVDDSGLPETKAPAHCYVDFRPLSKSERRVVRGWLLLAALHEDTVDSTVHADEDDADGLPTSKASESHAGSDNDHDGRDG